MNSKKIYFDLLYGNLCVQSTNHSRQKSNLSNNLIVYRICNRLWFVTFSAGMEPDHDHDHDHDFEYGAGMDDYYPDHGQDDGQNAPSPSLLSSRGVSFLGPNLNGDGAAGASATASNDVVDMTDEERRREVRYNHDSIIINQLSRSVYSAPFTATASFRSVAPHSLLHSFLLSCLGYLLCSSDFHFI